MGKSTINHHFHSYVKLPEGNRVQIKTKAADELHVNNDDGDKKGCRE